MATTDAAEPATRSGSDLIAGAVTVAAILLFVGTGSAVLGDAVRALSGLQRQNDASLTAALLLNVALILFGWRRHRLLHSEVRTRTAAEARASVLAARDPLTGLLNRRSLAEDGAALIGAAAKRGKATALLMLDLDHFKTVNDVHGHAVGDALLRQVAQAIEAALPPGALVARLGGDEFGCAIGFDPHDSAPVVRAAESLLARLVRPFEAEGRLLHISASIGIARSDHDGQGIDGLMRSADIALYAAKRAGRNRLTWFDRAMERALQERAELENGLRTGIDAGEFIPWFEPQVSLADGRLIGFEVLARWQHPRLGLIEPDRFIPVAEETGQIAALSLSVIRQALAAARHWDGSLTVAVNISPYQLRDAWLAQKLIKLLGETGFPAGRLQVEITESALFDNLPLAQSLIASLKNQGVTVALDDFGTGYSSLAHLRALPFDAIKIDRSFVMSMTDNADSRAIVTAITGLGESLNLPITAEGVENAGIEAQLRALGCAKAQGWHYGKPMPLASVRRLLAEKRLLAA